MLKMNVAAAALGLTALAISNPAGAQSAGIHIFEANYGVPGRAMLITNIVAERCEGRFHCSFPVTNGFLGIDPVVGVGKQAVVYWTCGGGRVRSAFPEHDRAWLSC
jgi:hypothetical protein